MRTKNSIKNMIISFISNLLTIIIGLIAQTIFIKNLGTEYLGLNGLFTNIMSMLGVLEMGIGTAIIFNLYKPIYEKNQILIKSLMKFYQKCYFVIAFIIFIIGLIIFPFLPVIIRNITIDINVELVYILFLIDIVASYLLSYKRSILYAHQKNYYINIIHIIYLVLMNIIQIGILILTKDYYLYLIIKICFRIFENVTITILVNKLYSYLKEKNIEKLDNSIVKNITKKIKALFLHQIGSFVINGTDNIVISIFLGITYVGLYSNYFLIFSSISILFNQIFSSITASIGELLILNDKKKSFEIYKKINFANFWISGFTVTAIFVIMNSFIKIWIGEDYILSTVILSTLCINYYFQTMKRSITVFKDAAGIFYEDRFVPIVESITNLFFSIFLIKIFGLAGVFMGTILSTLVLHFYSYPKYVYIKIFNKRRFEYIISLFKYLSIILFGVIITFVFSMLIKFDNNLYQLISNLLLSLVIPNILYFILYKKSKEFMYFKELFLKLLKRGEANDL